MQKLGNLLGGYKPATCELLKFWLGSVSNSISTLYLDSTADFCFQSDRSGKPKIYDVVGCHVTNHSRQKANKYWFSTRILGAISRLGPVENKSPGGYKEMFYSRTISF